MFKELKFTTHKKVELIDLTIKVEELISSLAKGSNGLLNIHAPHATVALMLNENEAGLKKDLLYKIVDLFKDEYEHDKIDDNALAHLVSGFIGQTINLPVKKGKLLRGTWQNILFIELDGPRRERRVILQFIKG